MVRLLRRCFGRVLFALVAVLGVLVGLPAMAMAAPDASVVVGLVAGVGPAREMPEPPPVGQVREELAGLHVEDPHPMAGYARAKFPHWIGQGGECDTREVVLGRDGEGVQQDGKCRAVGGSWYSPYDGKTVPSSSQVDIDHMVPLANAWRSGADLWDTPRRKAFANDLVHSQLIAVSAGSNRSKADQSPDQWRPPDTAYWCTYSRAWTHVKSLYALNVTLVEKSVLVQMLDTCGPDQRRAA